MESRVTSSASFQSFISEQLQTACSLIVEEYERRQALLKDPDCAPAAVPKASVIPALGISPGESAEDVRKECSRCQVVCDTAVVLPNTPEEPWLSPPQPLKAVQVEVEKQTSNQSLGDGQIIRRPSQMATFVSYDDRTTWVVDPRSAWYLAWQHVLAVVVVFSNFFTPARYAFQDKSNWATYMDYTIDILFVIDIVLSFNVAQRSKHGWDWDRRVICKSYICSWRFWIDLVAVLPFSATAAALGAEESACAALNMLRLLRANRILIFFQDMQKNAHLNLMGVVIAKFVLFIILCTHTAGCVLYGLASYQGFNESTWVARADPGLPHKSWYTIYVHLLFWAVGTFKAGPAHGVLFPTSDSEMLLSVIAMIFNICLQTYLLSSMAALLTTSDNRIYAMRNSVKQLAQFSQRYGLTSELSRDIKSYLRFKFSVDQELDQNVLSGLPEIYRQRISHALYETLVSSLRIFQGCRSVFLQQLHGSLESTLHIANNDLVHVDDPATELQILAEGAVELYNDDDVVEMRFGGEPLTAVPFICGVAQPFSMRTKKLCRILSLYRGQWDLACSAFPEDVWQIKSNLLRFCQERRSNFTNGSTGGKAYDTLISIVESHLEEQRESAISSLCFAAAIGDTNKISLILRGHSANCADYDRRSPLHIAASKGQVSVIEMLIKGRANVNAIDNFGISPLLEAVRSQQMRAADFLAANGAGLGFQDQDQYDFESEVRSQSARSIKSKSTDGSSEPGQIRLALAGELCEAASNPEKLWYLSALIEHGARINAGDYDARTALHVASAVGNRPAVEILLASPSIDANVVDRFGRTPLMEAVRHGHEPCARLLRAFGAWHGFCEDPKNSDNTNAVHAGPELCQAAFANHTVYLHGLVSLCGISVDAADYDRRTALMLACAEGNVNAALSLVQLKADILRHDRWGHSALTEAQDHGHPHLHKILEQVLAAQGGSAAEGPVLR